MMPHRGGETSIIEKNTSTNKEECPCEAHLSISRIRFFLNPNLQRLIGFFPNT